MTRFRLHALILLTACALLACAGTASESPQGSSEAVADDGARTLPIPGAGASAQPAPTASGQEIRWTVPAEWVAETPSSSMRHSQYRIPGPGGDAECVVFYFGPGQGGDPLANARRWAGQFQQPDGSSSLELMEITRVESTEAPTMVVEVTGTYEGMSMGPRPSEPQPGAMLLGGIVEAPSAPWFFKLTGPEPTVRAVRPAFYELMRTITIEGR